jgi:hypothetical protein
MIASVSETFELSSLSNSHSLTRDPSKTLSDSSQGAILEQAVLSWFEVRGIRKTNPEELLQELHSSQRLSLRPALRKLSAPDELSQLGRRRAKGTNKVIWD